MARKSEHNIIEKYMETFRMIMCVSYDDDPFDAFKIAEYACMCERIRKDMKTLYEQIPQTVKDGNRIPKPVYPYR